MADAKATIDNETGLINKGDKIINKSSSEGLNSLTNLEKAIYYVWVMDDAVRNSGTLEPMPALNRTSISEL